MHISHYYTPVNPTRPAYAPGVRPGNWWDRLGWLCTRCGRSNSPASMICSCVQSPLQPFPAWC